jgi:hypothetical protein
MKTIELLFKYALQHRGRTTSNERRNRRRRTVLGLHWVIPVTIQATWLLVAVQLLAEVGKERNLFPHVNMRENLQKPREPTFLSRLSVRGFLGGSFRGHKGNESDEKNADVCFKDFHCYEQSIFKIGYFSLLILLEV